jgi:hypothetical protein
MTTLQAVLVETLFVRHGEVTIYELRVGPDTADLHSFEIRTSTGYRAVFPHAHTECDRKPCVKPHCRASHTPTMCHGPHHIEQVRELAQRVAKTYGRGLKDRTDPSVGRTTLNGGSTGKRVLNMPTREWAETAWAKTMESVVEP